MQLKQHTGTLKAITLTAAVMAASPSYSSVDEYSGIISSITDTHLYGFIRQSDTDDFRMYADQYRFMSYLERWEEETMFESSIGRIVGNRNFKAIVSMGSNAVPFILDEIDRNPSTLVWSLNYIYGKKVSNSPNLTVSEACKLWVKTLRG